MAAGKYDFIIEQGATFTRQITWQDSSGVGIDLTGFSLSGKIRRKYTDTTALTSFTMTIIDANSGIFSFSLTALETSILQASECVYDIEANTGSTVYRVLEGKCTITPEATK